MTVWRCLHAGRGLVTSLAAWLLVGCVGCTGVPILVPDLAQASTPVQLAGAHGPLSAAKSKAILDRLAAQGEESVIFERHLADEESLAGSPLTTGNQVLLLQDGPSTYRAMFAAIESARDHINLKPTSWTTMRWASDSPRR